MNTDESTGEIEKNIDSMITGSVLELANNQYSVQWTKIGNLQTSAGSLLTLISVIAAIVLVVVSNSTSISVFTISISFINMAFFISMITSVLYMILSCIFMFLLLRSKEIKLMPNPAKIHKEILDSVKREETGNNEKDMILFVNTYLINKIDEEVSRTDKILQRNRFWYGKCLISSFLSLLGSILALVFINSNIYNNNSFFSALIAFFSYAVFLSFIVIIFFPRRTK